MDLQIQQALNRKLYQGRITQADCESKSDQRQSVIKRWVADQNSKLSNKKNSSGDGPFDESSPRSKMIKRGTMVEIMDFKVTEWEEKETNEDTGA